MEKKTTKGSFFVRFRSKDVYGFAEHQKNATFGFVYKLALQRNSDNHAISHRAGTEAANLALAERILLEDISLFVPHYTPVLSPQTLMLEHFVPGAATDLSYIKRSFYTGTLTSGNNWIFKLGAQSGNDVPFYVSVGFMQIDQSNQQHKNKDTF